MAATSPHIGETTTTSNGVEIRPSARALAVGCGPVERVTDPDSKVGPVKFDDELTYWPTVPVSGWFSSVRADPSDAGASPEEVLHGMWFGDRVIWVAADAPPVTLAALRELNDKHSQWHATVRSWPADRLAQMDPSSYAPAAWGITQSCRIPDERVIDELFAAAAPAPGAGSTSADQVVKAAD